HTAARLVPMRSASPTPKQNQTIKLDKIILLAALTWILPDPHPSNAACSGSMETEVNNLSPIRPRIWEALIPGWMGESHAETGENLRVEPVTRGVRGMPLKRLCALSGDEVHLTEAKSQ